MSRLTKFLSFALALTAFSSIVIQPTDAEASWAEIWVRADGSYISGSDQLRFFSENEAGLGYGFALGVEVLQIDVFADINIQPNGSMFNMVGLGMDFDVIPGDTLYLAPAGAIAYFFGAHEDDAPGDAGFLARAGAQFEVRLFPTIYAGADGYFGGLLSYSSAESEFETGLYYQASLYLMFRFGI